MIVAESAIATLYTFSARIDTSKARDGPALKTMTAQGVMPVTASRPVFSLQDPGVKEKAD
jgi:hypothetical protein